MLTISFSNHVLQGWPCPSVHRKICISHAPLLSTFKTFHHHCIEVCGCHLRVYLLSNPFPITSTIKNESIFSLIGWVTYFDSEKKSPRPNKLSLPNKVHNQWLDEVVARKSTRGHLVGDWHTVDDRLAVNDCKKIKKRLNQIEVLIGSDRIW